MAPLRSSRSSMQGVLQPWPMAFGTAHGTEPRTPQKRTRIRSYPSRKTIARFPDPSGELSQQFLCSFRIAGQDAAEIFLRDAAQLGVGQGDHRRGPWFVEQ